MLYKHFETKVLIILLEYFTYITAYLNSFHIVYFILLKKQFLVIKKT